MSVPCTGRPTGKDRDKYNWAWRQRCTHKPGCAGTTKIYLYITFQKDLTKNHFCLGQYLCKACLPWSSWLCRATIRTSTYDRLWGSHVAEGRLSYSGLVQRHEQRGRLVRRHEPRGRLVRRHEQQKGQSGVTDTCNQGLQTPAIRGYRHL